MRIAISGKMCSGKSSLKEFLINKLARVKELDSNNSSIPIKELSFGKPIKEMYTTYFPYNHNKDRKAYQSIGDTFRNINNDVFVEYLVSQCDNNKIIIVDDLRFKNEMRILKDNGFVTIRINVDEELQKERFSNLYPVEDFEITKTYKSEIDLDNNDNFDLTISSNNEDYNKVWKYLVSNYMKEICKIIFQSSSFNDPYDLSLYTPRLDILTGNYIHRSCHWHGIRNEIVYKINDI